MCMIHCESRTNRSKNAKWVKKTFYKVLCPIVRTRFNEKVEGKWERYTRLEGPYYNIGCLWQKPGWQTSNASKMFHLDGAGVYRGIHVCNTEKEACDFIANYPTRCKIVKVTCYRRDLISIQSDAKRSVFKKVFLSADEFKKALANA